ncbi:hypothetical protein BDY21DRAFT_341333 [Lineolata rhizophorae]|uniref:Secreted protein n=1 Tax=Lineolata rhizophorae TaxID=578093 RepID=A0A6A6P425_9PEZI|nr:hypothetical protein BDY21DRAFT_341333 [Lineolata rhizophorae]
MKSSGLQVCASVCLCLVSVCPSGCGGASYAASHGEWRQSGDAARDKNGEKVKANGKSVRLSKQDRAAYPRGRQVLDRGYRGGYMQQMRAGILRTLEG